MLIHYIMELIKFQKNAKFSILFKWLPFGIYNLQKGGKTAWK